MRELETCLKIIDGTDIRDPTRKEVFLGIQVKAGNLSCQHVCQQDRLELSGILRNNIDK